MRRAIVSMSLAALLFPGAAPASETFAAFLERFPAYTGGTYGDYYVGHEVEMEGTPLPDRVALDWLDGPLTAGSTISNPLDPARRHYPLMRLAGSNPPLVVVAEEIVEGPQTFLVAYGKDGKTATAFRIGSSVMSPDPGPVWTETTIGSDGVLETRERGDFLSPLDGEYMAEDSFAYTDCTTRWRVEPSRKTKILSCACAPKGRYEDSRTHESLILDVDKKIAYYQSPAYKAPIKLRTATVESEGQRWTIQFPKGPKEYRLEVAKDGLSLTVRAAHEKDQRFKRPNAEPFRARL